MVDLTRLNPCSLAVVTKMQIEEFHLIAHSYLHACFTYKYNPWWTTYINAPHHQPGNDSSSLGNCDPPTNQVVKKVPPIAGASAAVDVELLLLNC